uniref:Uncharacterized protein n=1 Tax=Ixodes ricinus TaxID=34613 RepID=A0A6B0U756_IXORI
MFTHPLGRHHSAPTTIEGVLVSFFSPFFLHMCRAITITVGVFQNSKTYPRPALLHYLCCHMIRIPLAGVIRIHPLQGIFFYVLL